MLRDGCPGQSEYNYWSARCHRWSSANRTAKSSTTWYLQFYEYSLTQPHADPLLGSLQLQTPFIQGYFQSASRQIQGDLRVGFAPDIVGLAFSLRQAARCRCLSHVLTEMQILKINPLSRFIFFFWEHLNTDCIGAGGCHRVAVSHDTLQCQLLKCSRIPLMLFGGRTPYPATTDETCSENNRLHSTNVWMWQRLEWVSIFGAHDGSLHCNFGQFFPRMRGKL